MITLLVRYNWRICFLYPTIDITTIIIHILSIAKLYYDYLKSTYLGVGKKIGGKKTD